MSVVGGGLTSRVAASVVGGGGLASKMLRPAVNIDEVRTT